jgi:vesicular inhibitory amino acid transporter
MVFVGESVPKFGKILSLVGGSTITLLTFVLPSFFYMRLCDQEKQHNWPEKYYFLTVHVKSFYIMEF